MDFIRKNQLLKKQILQKALPSIQQEGWNYETVIRAGEDLEIPEEKVRFLIPEGPAGIVQGYIELWNEEFYQRAEIVEGNMKEKVFALTKQRLLLEAPLREHWIQGIKLGAWPSHIIASKLLNYKTAELILLKAGDFGAGFEARMIGLSGIYFLTEVQLSRDKEDFENTWDFLDKSLTTMKLVKNYISTPALAMNIMLNYNCSMINGLWKIPKNHENPIDGNFN